MIPTENTVKESDTTDIYLSCNNIIVEKPSDHKVIPISVK